MTDSQATAVAPGPPPPPPPGMPSGSDRFFSWVRGIGIARSDGWIGGVCAGIAARIGIDPVIVRGVFVVAALFGLPMFLVYGVAWALLPDAPGRIHFQELLRRRFDPAMVGIGLMLLVGLFPVVPWFFVGVLPFGYLAPNGWVDWSPSGVVWTLVAAALVAGVIFLIARTSRRAPTAGVPDPRTASADHTAPGSPARDDSGVDAPADPAAAGHAAASLAPAGSLLTPPEPASAAPVDADDAEIAAWRAQHDAWRAQDDAWRRQQQDAERSAREQARRERAEAGAAFAAEASERRRVRRATRPRTSAAYVAVVIGAALVAGALTSLGFGGDDPVLAVAFGLLAASLVLAVAMIVAGTLRRRSGFLAFVTVVVLLAGTITAWFPITRGIAFGSTSVDNFEPKSFTQLGGSLSIYIADVDGSPAPIVIDKRGGSTDIQVDPGVLLDLELAGVEEVEWILIGGPEFEVLDQGRWTADGDVVRERIDTRADGELGTRQSVRLHQLSGTAFDTPYVTIYESTED